MTEHNELPEVNGRYLPERSLGSQAAGRFYVGVDAEMGGRITIFFPRLTGVSAADFVRGLSSELHRCAPLRDTPYCTLRDAGLSPQGEAFVVLDRPQGTPLSALLREQDQLTIDKALSIAIQLCDLVHRAHVIGIYPVPTSPDTVICDPQPGGRQRVSIVDLALHRGAYSGTIAHAVRASLYQAPQLRAGMAPDPRDDVFAITAILHSMAFGVAPTPMSAHGPADGTGWPALPSGGRRLDRRLEACLQTVLLKGLAPIREERFAQIGELQRSLMGLRQLMSLSPPAFELLAATRSRMGRRADPLENVQPRPGMERARRARAAIRQVMDQGTGQAANLRAMAGETEGRTRFRVING